MNANDDTRVVAAVAVIDLKGAIGYRGRLLCHLPADLRHFKAITLGHSVVMGRATFESLPNGPLPGRQNIVVSRRRDYAPEGVTVAHDFDEAVAAATCPGEVLVIGGAQLYAAAMPHVTRLYLTQIDHAFERADAHFPHLDLDRWTIEAVERHAPDDRNPYPYTFLTLKKTTPTRQ